MGRRCKLLSGNRFLKEINLIFLKNNSHLIVCTVVPRFTRVGAVKWEAFALNSFLGWPVFCRQLELLSGNLCPTYFFSSALLDFLGGWRLHTSVRMTNKCLMGNCYLSLSNAACRLDTQPLATTPWCELSRKKRRVLDELLDGLVQKSRFRISLASTYVNVCQHHISLNRTYVLYFCLPNDRHV